MLSFFPLDVLDEIWDLIESVSEGFVPTPYILKYLQTGKLVSKSRLLILVHEFSEKVYPIFAAQCPVSKSK